MPPLGQVSTTFKKAPRAEAEDPEPDRLPGV